MNADVLPEIHVRPLSGSQDFEAVVDLERAVWQYPDLDADGGNALTIASRFLGQVLGAFDGERLVGFSLAYATLTPGRMHSHRVGVDPEYQGRGVGAKLKMAQREDALAKGFSVMQWTFDPMQPGNANFNLVRLGGVSKTYIPNFYGITSSPLHGGLPTDRLLIEWDLAGERVKRILAGEKLSAGVGALEISLPVEKEDRTLAVQSRLRDEFTARFAEGYSVSGFRKEVDAFKYVLEKL